MSALNDLLGAAKSVAPTSGKKPESDTNRIHFVNMIIRVYALVRDDFKGVTEDAIIDKCFELCTKEKVQKLFIRRGIICDDLFVTVFEAMRWTGLFIVNGVSKNFRLALIKPEHIPYPVNNVRREPVSGVWNTILLEDVTGSVYDVYGRALVTTGHSLQILSKSSNLYEVKFK